MFTDIFNCGFYVFMTFVMHLYVSVCNRRTRNAYTGDDDDNDFGNWLHRYWYLHLRNASQRSALTIVGYSIYNSV